MISALSQAIASRSEPWSFRSRIAESRAGHALRPLATAIVSAAALLAAAPASADVIELSELGAVTVIASDVAAAPQRVAQDSTFELQLPDEALTPPASSTAPSIYADAVRQVAEMNDVSPALLEALVWQESRWRSGARSHAGAIGLTQLMPGTARDLGVNPYDVNANLFGGARYLRQQLDRFNGDLELALAAYNAGPGRVLRSRAIPNIAETQSYVRSVVDRLSYNNVQQGAKR